MTSAQRPTLPPPDDAWLVVIDPQVVFADPSSDWASPMFDGIVPVVDELVAHFGERTIVTRWLPGTDHQGSWQAYFTLWSFADRPDDDPLFDLVPAARAWVHGDTLDVTTFGKWGQAMVERTGEQHPQLVLVGVSTDCCVISTALAAADAGATVTVVEQGCAGSTPENHAAAMQVMGLYAPQIVVVGAEAEAA
ncbi:cysteine hydrolase family protein [Aestuariimicrobium ganziense]|uniref:cysteine hydrolase family protein n=1 Tax=Aestuariimicrobium ganziense TaxID=2773677 RepID=UPI002E298FCE|nr:isochorismatase family protein [Aestuariimicrobium ganziense]